jgi:Protein of unknown function (DUF2934)
MTMKQCKTELSSILEQADELRLALASRAFSIFEDDGGQHGRDLDHWLEAERQLHSSTVPPEVTERTGTVVIRTRVEVTPGTDLVANVSKEKVLIFRAADIGEDRKRDLLQVIPLHTEIEIDKSEAFIDGSDLVVTCTCPKGRA